MRHHVDIKALLPVVVAGRCRAFGFTLCETRVGADQINATFPVARLFEKSRNCLWIGDITGNRQAVDLCRDLIGCCFVDVRNDDLGALIPKGMGDRAANAASGACDDANASRNLHQIRNWASVSSSVIS